MAGESSPIPPVEFDLTGSTRNSTRR